MADKHDGDLLHRTILVRGFEGDESDLRRIVQRFGRVEGIKIKQFRTESHRPQIDLGNFLGKTARFERGSNRIANLMETLPPAETDQTSGAEHTSVPERSDVPATGTVEGTFPPINSRARVKALECCESVIFQQFSSEQRSSLAEECHLVHVLPEQELFVQGDTVNHLFILIHGVLRIFTKFPVDFRGAEGLYEDEIIVGAVSGTGQLLGEVDCLRMMKDSAHSHSISVSADVHSIVVAVPIETIAEKLGQVGLSIDQMASIVDALDEKRTSLLDLLSRNKSKSQLTQILTTEEMRYLVDVCGRKTYGQDQELQETPEYLNSVAAIVLEGELKIQLTETERCTDEAQASESHLSHANILPHDAAVKSLVYAPVEPDGSYAATSIANRNIQQPTCIAEGEVLQECMKEARGHSGFSRAKKLVTQGVVEILFVNYDDLRPVFSSSFAMRKYAEENKIAHPHDFSELGDVCLSKRYSILADGPFLSQMPEPLSKFPWWRNQEQRLMSLAAARRRGRDDWRSDLEEDALGEPHKSGTYVNNAPYFWNKTAIPTASTDFRIHDTSLSAMEASILYSNVLEASTSVQELESLWSDRFARAKLAGQSSGYKALLHEFVVKLRQCGDDYVLAEQVGEDYQKQGVFADASILREFVTIYNKSKPIQIDKAADALRQLLETEHDDELQYLLSESAHLWCSLGFTSIVEALVESSKDANLIVPRTVYTSMVHGWIRLKELEKATETMFKMAELGFVPELETMNNLLALYISLGFEEDACTILDELERNLFGGAEGSTLKTYVIVISGMVRHGDAPRVETMVRRMLDYTQEPGDAMCLNLVVETWCISGNMRQANKALARMRQDFGCEPDEQTYALLAAGWARAGKIRVASDVMLSLAMGPLDSAKIDLNAIVFDWDKKQWRQVKGFEMKLPTVMKQQPPTSALSQGVVLNSANDIVLPSSAPGGTGTSIPATAARAVDIKSTKSPSRSRTPRLPFHFYSASL